MKIAILSALFIEIEYLYKQYDWQEKDLFQHQLSYELQLSQHHLLMTTSGIGKVNAAIFCQQLIHQFQPDIIINIGIAGGINSNLKVFDFVIASHFTHHDVRLSQMKNTFPYCQIYPANAELLNFFKEHVAMAVVGGIASGESFVTDKTSHERIVNELDCLAVDMEASALAQTCLINNIPFISFKCLSDLADQQATSDYQANEKEACNRLGKVISQIIDESCV